MPTNGVDGGRRGLCKRMSISSTITPNYEEPVNGESVVRVEISISAGTKRSWGT